MYYNSISGGGGEQYVTHYNIPIQYQSHVTMLTQIYKLVLQLYIYYDKV